MAGGRNQRVVICLAEIRNAPPQIITAPSGSFTTPAPGIGSHLREQDQVNHAYQLHLQQLQA
jgi:hypothetical protein